MRNFWAIPQNGAKKPDGANRPVRCVVFMGSFRRVATVARPSLHRPCCAASAGPGSMPFPLPLSVAPPRCAAPLRCSRCRPVAPHPPGRGACRFRFPSPLRRPVALFPLSPRCAPPVGLEITPLPCAIPPPLGWSLRVAFVASCCAAPCRAAGFIAWRPAPDRSAGPRCRAPCGRCPPRSPTR